MNLLKNIPKNFIFILLLLCSPFLVTFLAISEDLPSNERDIQINTSQEKSGNFTIDTKFPEIIFIEGLLEIKISVNTSGDLDILFIEKSAGTYFSNTRKTLKISNNSDSTIVNLKISPYLATVPGRYQFQLVINFTEEGNNDSEEILSENFESILAIGYLILFSVLIIFGTAIIVIISQSYDEDMKKAIDSTLTPSTAPDISGLPAGKIKCPECKAVIDEGLTFCPECGVRIPEFLRYRPESSSGIL